MGPASPIGEFCVNLLSTIDKLSKQYDSSVSNASKM